MKAISVLALSLPLVFCAPSERRAESVCNARGFDRGRRAYFFKESSSLGTPEGCGARCAQDKKCRSYAVGSDACLLYSSSLYDRMLREEDRTNIFTALQTLTAMILVHSFSSTKVAILSLCLDLPNLRQQHENEGQSQRPATRRTVRGTRQHQLTPHRLQRAAVAYPGTTSENTMHFTTLPSPQKPILLLVLPSARLVDA